LFILYEVFLARTYFIPSTVLPCDEVRLIVDCGANIGLGSLFFASRYPNARVLAIEPHPDNFELLKFNTAHEPRIIPVHACVVGKISGKRYITIDQPAWGNTINQTGDGVAVEQTTVEQLMQKTSYAGNVDRIDLLKIDIEGTERELFAHADFLRQTRLVVIELHGDYGFACLQRDVEPFGFDARAPDRTIRMVTVQKRRKTT